MQTYDMPSAAPARGAASLRRRLGASWRLGALTLAVLAAHLLVLSGLPWARPGASPGEARAAPMQTRTVPAEVSPSATAGPAPAAAPAPAARSRTLSVAKATPPPAALPAASPEPGTRGGTARPSAHAAAPGPAAAAPTPAHPSGAEIGPVAIAPPTQLRYKVHASTKGLAYSAHAELLWQHDGSRYDARLTITAFLIGTRTQTSVGQLGAQGLAPLRFADRRRGEKAAHFDRARQRISFSANTPEAPLLAGAQDRLSLFFQLGALVAGAPGRYGPGSVLSMQTAGTRDAEPWLFTVQGPVRLSFAGQPLDAIALLRQPREPYDSRVEIWLAPALHYLPARLRITQAGGDELDLQLTQAHPPEAAPAAAGQP